MPSRSKPDLTTQHKIHPTPLPTCQAASPPDPSRQATPPPRNPSRPDNPPQGETVMFRVPQDPESPTFDEVFKVGFFGWLTSKKADRQEWKRRRDYAGKLARINMIARNEAKRVGAHRAWDTRRGEIVEDSQMRAVKSKAKRDAWEDGRLAKLETRAEERGNEKVLAKVKARRAELAQDHPAESAEQLGIHFPPGETTDAPVLADDCDV